MRKTRTLQGDTWDMIASRVYQGIGGEYLCDILMEANPEYIDYVRFPGGLMLNVPEADIPEVKTLPPWID